MGFTSVHPLGNGFFTIDFGSPIAAALINATAVLTAPNKNATSRENESATFFIRSGP